MLTDVLILSVSGYIFLFPGALLFFRYLRRSGRKQTLHHTVTALIFGYYLIGILTMTGITSFKAFSPRIVLIPFVDMIKGLVDTVLNVVLFLPLGFFLALLFKKYDNIRRVALTAFLLSLSIELVQMFGMGTTDINDLMTNTAGACLGYFMYRLLLKSTRKEVYEKVQANKIDDTLEVLFFVIASFVIMVTVQPFVIHSLFSLA